MYYALYLYYTTRRGILRLECFLGAKLLLFQYSIVFVLHFIVFVFASYLYHTAGASSAWNVSWESLLFRYSIVFVFVLSVFVFASYLYHTAMDGEHPLLGMFPGGNIASLAIQQRDRTAIGATDILRR